MKIEKQVQMTLSNLDNEKYHFGTDNDFWLVYDEETNDAFEIWTSDGDGLGTDTQLISIPSGGAEITILNDLTVNNNLSIDNNLSVTGVLLAGSSANSSDFPEAKLIVSNGDTGANSSSKIGMAMEAAADLDGALAIGIYGQATSNGTASATAGYFVGKRSNSADTGSTTGFTAVSFLPHAGGDNIGLYVRASNGANNYAVDIQDGDFRFQADADFILHDNDSSALSFDASGKTGILEIDTTNSSEKVNMSGGLSVAGSIVSLSGLPTSDPAVAGQLWVDTSASYVIKVSQG